MWKHNLAWVNKISKFLFNSNLLFQCAEIFDYYFNNNNIQSHLVNPPTQVPMTTGATNKRNSSDADLDEIIGVSSSKAPKLSAIKRRYVIHFIHLTFPQIDLTSFFFLNHVLIVRPLVVWLRTPLSQSMNGSKRRTN